MTISTSPDQGELRLFDVSLREGRLGFYVIADAPERILAATVPAWGRRPEGPWPDGAEIAFVGDLVTVRHPRMGVLARVTERPAQVLDAQAVAPSPKTQATVVEDPDEFPYPLTPEIPSQTDALTVATDGACSGNPGPAGWAWVDQTGRWRSGGLVRSTNQVGELLGLLHAVRDHQHVQHLTVEIDSTYAMNTYLQWMDAHARRCWRTTAGKPTSNRDVIEQLIAARDARAAAGLPPVRLVKVKGHANGRHPLNDAADHQATAAARRARYRKLGPWEGEGMSISTVR